MKNRLEELRKERGIKQEELASVLKVSRQTIGSLENGRYNPSILLAFRIARYFKMNIEEILFMRRTGNEEDKVIYNLHFSRSCLYCCRISCKRRL